MFITHDDFDHYDPDGIKQVTDEETVVVAYDAVNTSDIDVAVRLIAEVALSLRSLPSNRHPPTTVVTAHTPTRKETPIAQRCGDRTALFD